MRKFTVYIAAALLLINLFANHPIALAQSPVVEALLFFSPTCGHCEMIAKNDLPHIQEKFGDSLSIIKIDISQPDGRQLYQSAVEYFKIPHERLGVPALVVGDQTLVGSREIPLKFPDLIAAGINSGGIALPALPGLQKYLEANDIQTKTSVDESKTSLLDKLEARIMRDPAGNTLAIIVLIGMLISIVGVSANFILVDSQKTKTPPNWIVPLLSIIGLGVALYLSVIETTSKTAICGPIGDCNTVQQSSYAMLFGVIPVGILGVVGYVAILTLWIAQNFLPVDKRNKAWLLIWILAWAGVAFSIYLTFLEPFVIGATCLWCITSAIIMTLLLWITTPMAKLAMQSPEDDRAR